MEVCVSQNNKKSIASAYVELDLFHDDLITVEVRNVLYIVGSSKISNNHEFISLGQYVH